MCFGVQLAVGLLPGAVRGPNDIAARPADAAPSPFGPEPRSEVMPAARWIERVLIR